MKKKILTIIPELKTEGNKLLGGFIAVPASHMAKIKGGGGVNDSCTNNAQCNTGTNNGCTNKPICEGSMNYGCQNQGTCYIGGPTPVIQ